MMLKKIAIGFGILVGLYGLTQLMPSTQMKNEAASWQPYAYDLAQAGNRIRGGLLWEIMPQDIRFAGQSIQVRQSGSAGLKTGMSGNDRFVKIMNCEGSACVELTIPRDRYEDIKAIVFNADSWSWIDAAITCVSESAWCGANDWDQLERQYGIDGKQALRDYMAGWDGKSCSEVQHCRELTAILGPIS